MFLELVVQSLKNYEQFSKTTAKLITTASTWTNVSKTIVHNGLLEGLAICWMSVTCIQFF